MGETMYSFKDLYPNWQTQSDETSVKANPEYQDQEVLNEDLAIAEKTDRNNASRKNILIAVVILIACIVLFGVK